MPARSPKSTLRTDWDEKVAREAETLQQIAPDLLLANVPYLPLAGAKRANIPAVGLCSLNWADILEGYVGSDEKMAPVLAQMRRAYQEANAFVACEPCMPMPDLQNKILVGPIARIGTSRRAEILQQFDLPQHAKLILVAPGGLPMELPVDHWPVRENIYWLVQSNWQVSGPHIISLNQLSFTFIDVLASADLLVGKPGYGSVSEAVCNGIPFLYLKRGDWPEEPYLLEWLHQQGVGCSVERAAFYAGDFLAEIEVLTRSRPKKIQPLGVAQAVKALEELAGGC